MTPQPHGGTFQSHISSVAPTKFYSDIAQALHRASATVGDKQDFVFWDKMGKSLAGLH